MSESDEVVAKAKAFIEELARREEARKKEREETQELIQTLGSRAEVAMVIWSTSNVDEFLGLLLRHKLPNVTSKTFDKKLFTNMGPFSTLSSKIDVAYAMGLIEKKMHSDLDKVRRIRNEFAHTTEQIDTRSDTILDLLDKFSDFDRKKDDPVDISHG